MPEAVAVAVAVGVAVFVAVGVEVEVAFGVAVAFAVALPVVLDEEFGDEVVEEPADAVDEVSGAALVIGLVDSVGVAAPEEFVAEPWVAVPAGDEPVPEALKLDDNPSFA